jgi:hypothetical protein
MDILVREAQLLAQLQLKVVKRMKSSQRKLTPSILSSSDMAEEEGPRSFAHRATSQSSLEQKGAYSSSPPSLLPYSAKLEGPHID